jgi:hypothetical protein
MREKEMGTSVVVGKWIEKVSREETRCPSYYAADWETLVTIPGEYPLTLTFEGGYTIPMPYWLLCGIAATRKAGALYSGFGGNNFASTKLEAGESVALTLQMSAYKIRELVESGRVELLPGFEWLLDEKYSWQSARAPKTWADVAKLAA